tara:strand:+ start:753 stop:1178 length:426 start_codon:yes stop_codon:yes gene_type:complete
MNTTHKNIKQVYKGGKGVDIKLDAHCWVEIEGEVCDYDNSVLQSCSFYGTNRIVRKPFSQELQIECLPYVLECVGAKLQTATELNMEEDFINHCLTECGNCFTRSVLLHHQCKQKKIKSKIIIGSLGFIQDNNKDIFYEYG